jgi:hypothetical protein
MRVAPDFEIVLGEQDGLVMGDAEHADIGEAGEPAADKDRVRESRIVIAGKDDNRQLRRREKPEGVFEDRGAQLIALEGIAGQYDQMRPQGTRRYQHRTQPCRPVAACRRHPILVDMQVRAVDESHLSTAQSGSAGNSAAVPLFCQNYSPVIRNNSAVLRRSGI